MASKREKSGPVLASAEEPGDGQRAERIADERTADVEERPLGREPSPRAIDPEPPLSSIPPSYIVGPASLVAAYRRRQFQRIPGQGGVTVGEPTYEVAGVPNRRAMVIHRLPPEDILFIQGLFAEREHPIVVLPAWPEDWRYPEAG